MGHGDKRFFLLVEDVGGGGACEHEHIVAYRDSDAKLADVKALAAEGEPVSDGVAGLTGDKDRFVVQKSEPLEAGLEFFQLVVEVVFSGCAVWDSFSADGEVLSEA